MLRITLAVNADQVADYEVRRVTGVDARPEPNDINEYEVRPIQGGSVGPLIGTVLHQYSDDVRELAAVALRMVGSES